MTKTTVLADGFPLEINDLLGDEIELLAWDDDTTVPADRAADVQGILVYGHPIVDAALIDRLPALKVISNHGVGVDHIDVAAAEQRGVPVGNTPGCLDQATADMTMALLLSAARNVVVGDRFARSTEFTHYDPSMWIGQEVSASKLGIVGLGRIGKEVAKRARGFDMTVTYHNRNRIPDAEASLQVAYESLDRLLSSSDFISLNCPLTDQTQGLISQAQFALMKPSAFLINMARGPVVNTSALLDALRSNKIAGAAIDVTDPEPLPRDHPLLSLTNLVITPHLGSASNRTRRRMMEMTVANCRAGLDGKQLPYPVKPKRE